MILGTGDSLCDNNGNLFVLNLIKIKIKIREIINSYCKNKIFAYLTKNIFKYLEFIFDKSNQKSRTFLSFTAFWKFSLEKLSLFFFF